VQFARAAAVFAAAGLALALAACTSDGGQAAAPTPTATAWTVQATAGATPGAGPAEFRANASAADNRPAFDAAIRAVLAGKPNADGAAVTAALKSAGFPMSATQVTDSKTSAELQPGSIMVGVKIGKECLVGQWGSAVDGYQSAVTPVLGSGGCLIGGIPAVG
jgi:hypothetical protein